MRHLISNARRRRLRMIQTIEDRALMRDGSRKADLSISPDSEETRQALEEIQSRLFEECRGNPSAVLHIERVGHTTISVALNRPYLLIGSDPACDVRLEPDEIKPRHCLLQWIDGCLFCCDVSQRTSFFPGKPSTLNGQWLGEQPVSVGPYRLLLEDAKAPQPPQSSPLDRSASTATNQPQLGLRFNGVEQDDNLWKFDRTLTLIGRGSQCKLRLNHKSIANVQGYLLHTSSGRWLIDLANENTTGVNDQAIRIAQIDIGDMIQLGQFRVELVSTEFTSSEPVIREESPAERPFEKPLPPIQFDRQPKAPPKRTIEPEDLPAKNRMLEMILTSVDEMRSDVDLICSDAEIPRPRMQDTQRVTAKAHVVNVGPKNDWLLKANPQIEPTPALAKIIENQDRIETQAEPRHPIVETVGLNPIPAIPTVSIRIHPTYLSPAKLANYSFVHSTSHVCTTSYPELISKPQIIDATFCPTVSMVCPTVESKVRPESEQETHKEPTPMAWPTQQPSEAGFVVPTDSLAQFIEIQRTELNSLKLRLRDFQQVYEQAAGNLISKRTRDSLERPVLESMKSYESMVAHFDEFVEAHRHAAK